MSWFRTMLHRVRAVGRRRAAAFPGWMPPGPWHSSMLRPPPARCIHSLLRLPVSTPLSLSWPVSHQVALHPHPTPAPQEPVIVWSFIIGGVGIALPLVVPPVREAMGYGAPTPKAPPPVSKVRVLGGVLVGGVPGAACRGGHAPCRLRGAGSRQGLCVCLPVAQPSIAPLSLLAPPCCSRVHLLTPPCC